MRASGQRFMITGTKHLLILITETRCFVSAAGQSCLLPGLSYLCYCILTLLPAAFRKGEGTTDHQ